jgi:hypothetical protein
MTSLCPSLLVTANAIPTPEIAKELKPLLQFPLDITAGCSVGYQVRFLQVSTAMPADVSDRT